MGEKEFGPEDLLIDRPEPDADPEEEDPAVDEEEGESTEEVVEDDEGEAPAEDAAEEEPAPEEPARPDPEVAALKAQVEALQQDRQLFLAAIEKLSGGPKEPEAKAADTKSPLDQIDYAEAVLSESGARAGDEKLLGIVQSIIDQRDAKLRNEILSAQQERVVLDKKREDFFKENPDLSDERLAPLLDTTYNSVVTEAESAKVPISIDEALAETGKRVKAIKEALGIKSDEGATSETPAAKKRKKKTITLAGARSGRKSGGDDSGEKSQRDHMAELVYGRK